MSSKIFITRQWLCVMTLVLSVLSVATASVSDKPKFIRSSARSMMIDGGLNKNSKEQKETHYLDSDIVIDRSSNSERHGRNLIKVEAPPTNRQKAVWDFLNTKIDAFKPTSKGVYTVSGDRPTLTKFHYMIQPVWWNDQDITDPSLTMDMTNSVLVLEQVRQYYRDMSFGAFELSWTVLPQRVVDTSSVLPDDEKTNGTPLVEAQGFVKGKDFDGVMLVFFPAEQGDYAGTGGFAGLNSQDLWMGFDEFETDAGGATGIDFAITRHEMGHNFGHPHHKSYKYWYRETGRNDGEGENSIDDGFDMMSSGNQYAVSDFALPSKWFFNWVPQSAIVSLQPEGATLECPQCRKAGTFTLKTFDNASKPPLNNDLMGVHIPITIGETEFGETQYFSTWLSYRGSGVDGKASGGLSVHLTWFGDFGQEFGSSYDSMNYDAFGDSTLMIDSFVLPGTCYVIAPSIKVLDFDYLAADAIQPVVCVDSINVGSDITISVSFLDPNAPPAATVAVDEFNLGCAVVASELPDTVDATKYSVVQVSGTGIGGLVTLSSLCPKSGAATDANSMTAYFYDSYPYAPIAFNSPPGYGSFRGLTFGAAECCQPGTTVSSTGALVVKISEEELESFHLAEVEIFDQNGKNVAKDANFYGKDLTFGGFDERCFNDGDTTVNGAKRCGNRAGSYIFCVLNARTDIRSVTIHSYDIADLKVEIFSSATDLKQVEELGEEMGQISFHGLLASFEVLFLESSMPPSRTQVTLRKEFPCPNSSASISYQSVFGNTWVLTSRDGGSFNEASIDLSCKATSCSANQFITSGGSCLQCPANTFAAAGATSIDACISCPAGTVPGSNPFSATCYTVETYEQITEALGWRIWAPNFHTVLNGQLDVFQLDFFETIDCSGTPISPTVGTPIDSGNAGDGFAAADAFGDGMWGGRRGKDGTYWLGKLFDSPTTLRCLKIETPLAEGFKEMRVQAFDGTKWVNAWVQKDMEKGAGGMISLDYNLKPSITASPTLRPTAPPTPAPTPAPTAGPAVLPSFCFSAIATVDVKNQGITAMRDLQIGDEVLVANDKYEPVYSFGHYSHDLNGEYLQIYTKSTSSTSVLEVSKDHLVFTNGSNQSVPASSLRVGSKLTMVNDERRDGGDHSVATVEAIYTVSRNGAYAPFTPSGTIAVNGILASTFVAFGDTSSLELAGGLLPLSFQQLAHTFESPHRLVCHVIGRCPRETYNKEGISSWNAGPFAMAQWLVRQNSFVVTAILLPLLLLFGSIAIVEQCICGPWFLFLMIGCGWLAHGFYCATFIGSQRKAKRLSE